MNLRFLSVLAAFAILLNLAGAPAFAVNLNNSNRAKANQLVTLLPQSDAVVTVDVKRLFSEALPTMLASQEDMHSKVIGKIDEMASKTGIDVRSFDFLAVGIAIEKVKESEFDFQPVVIARGSVDSAALIAAAKAAANDRYKEEQIGNRSVFVFSAKEAIEKNKPAVKDEAKAGMIDRIIGKMSSEIAVTVVDGSTVAFGTPERVRQAAEGRTKVGPDVSNLLNRRNFAVLNFAARMPSGMSALLPLDDDDLGKNIDSIRSIFGTMDVANGSTVMHMTARTQQNSNANGLREALEGLQIVGKMLLGGSKREDQQLYARLLDRLKITRTGTEVSLDLQIAQQDVDLLVAMLVK